MATNAASHNNHKGLSLRGGRVETQDMALHVRPFTPDDEVFVLSLASRLVIGISPWRSQERMLATAQGWLSGSMQRHGNGGMVFIAEDSQGERLGVATVAQSRHFTGDAQAELGELAVSETAAGHGAGRVLVEACAQWAREQGYTFLALGTGADNAQARGFYYHMGFLDEDVKLTKLL